MRRLPFLAAVVAAAACASGGTSGSAAAPAAARPAAAEPTALRYAAGTGRYRVEHQSHTVQEMMGQSQEADGGLTLVLSASLSAEGANLAAAFTVDSISVTGPQGSGLEQARGRTFRAVLTPAGRSVSLSLPDSSNPALQQMGEQFREFFPTLPAGTVAAGRSWTDTTADASNLGEIRVTSRAIREHRVVGWESRDGVRALRIATSSSYRITGSGSAQGQEIQLDGGGTASAEKLVSAAGVFLGQTASDSSTIMVNVVAMGLEIPVRRTSRSSVTRLP